MERAFWYQNMAAADVARLLTAAQVRDYLDKRHPTAAKKHKIATDVDSDGDMTI